MASFNGLYLSRYCLKYYYIVYIGKFLSENVHRVWYTCLCCRWFVWSVLVVVWGGCLPVKSMWNENLCVSRHRSITSFWESVFIFTSSYI